MNIDVQRAFQEVYSSKVWGGTAADDFWSGPGSHLPEFVDPYLDAVRDFVARLPVSVDAVDLGCGDFNIGSKLRGLFGRYVACDIVPELVERNKRRFADLDVEFQCLDLSSQTLPDGEVVFLRYVLQHLSNERIVQLVPKLGVYKYLLLTDAIPKQDFVANIDIPSGAGIRLHLDSGVVLTEPPFCLPIKSAKVLREYAWGAEAVIKTVLYEL